MIPILSRWFGWRVVKDTRKNCYEMNVHTGDRRVRSRHGGYQPIDKGWLKTGEWTPPPTWNVSPTFITEGVKVTAAEVTEWIEGLCKDPRDCLKCENHRPDHGYACTIHSDLERELMFTLRVERELSQQLIGIITASSACPLYEPDEERSDDPPKMYCCKRQETPYKCDAEKCLPDIEAAFRS